MMSKKLYTVAVLKAQTGNSKHALEAIVQLMREEMEGSGVQIATINPVSYRL